MSRYLIITADDVGLCPEVNHASILAAREGIVTSLDVMPNAPYFLEAARMIHGLHHELFDTGLHLCLNSEFSDFRWTPLLSNREVPSLYDDKGYCFRTVKELHENFNINELQKEIQAQIRYALDTLLNITHVTRHMYALDGLEGVRREDVWRFIAEMAKQHKVAIRSTDNKEAIWLEKQNTPIVRQVCTESHDIPVDRKKEEYIRLIKNLQPGISEFIVHCGYDRGKLKEITAFASRREKDFELMMDPDIKDVIRGEKIELICWQKVSGLLKMGQVL